MSEAKDRFVIQLEEITKSLQECQAKNSLDSCLKCDKVFECDIRKNYVSAVYLSMSKGEEGGFDF